MDTGDFVEWINTPYKRIILEIIYIETLMFFKTKPLSSLQQLSFTVLQDKHLPEHWPLSGTISFQEKNGRVKVKGNEQMEQGRAESKLMLS